MKFIIGRREYKKVARLAEMNYIRKALKLCKNNKKVLAQKLGINRSTLYRKLEKYKNLV